MSDPYDGITEAIQAIDDEVFAALTEEAPDKDELETQRVLQAMYYKRTGNRPPGEVRVEMRRISRKYVATGMVAEGIYAPNKELSFSPVRLYYVPTSKYVPATEDAKHRDPELMAWQEEVLADLTKAKAVGANLKEKLSGNTR